MTVKDLRTLVDNLDEYIHVPDGIERLKKTILHLAVSGKLVPQVSSEGTGQELYDQICAEKQKLISEGKLNQQKTFLEISKDEVPFRIPDSWKWVRLGAVSRSISYGYTESASKEEVGPKFVRITDIQNGLIDWDEVPFCKIDEKNKPKYLLEDGDILFARTGGTVGKSYLCKSPPESVFASYLIRVQPSKGFVSNYLLYYFETPSYWSSIYSDMSGTGQPNFNGTKLSHLLIPIPPNVEQRRIVAKIETIFALIDDLAEKYIAEQKERRKLVISSFSKLSKGESTLALDMFTEIVKTKKDAAELRKTILHLAVSGKLVPQDSSEGTGQELYDQIQAGKAKLVREGKLKKQKPLPEITQEEIPFEIPNSWKWSMLGEIGRIVGGGTPPSAKSEYYSEDFNLGIPWLTPADLRGYKDVFISHGKRNITETGLKNSSAQIMPKNTVLFSSRAPIGHTAIAKNEITTNQGFKSVAPYFGLNSEYIFRWLQFYGPTIDANASGTTFREVSGTIVARQLVPLAPQAEQTRIVQKTTQLLDLVSELESRLE